MLLRLDEGLGVAFHLFYIYFLFSPSPFFLLAFSGTHRGFFAYIYKDRLESLLYQELELSF